MTGSQRKKQTQNKYKKDIEQNIIKWELIRPKALGSDICLRHFFYFLFHVFNHTQFEVTEQQYLWQDKAKSIFNLFK